MELTINMLKFISKITVNFKAASSALSADYSTGRFVSADENFLRRKILANGKCNVN